MITVNGPDINPDEKAYPIVYHEQEKPLIAITFDIMPMNLDIYNAYCPRKDQIS